MFCFVSHSLFCLTCYVLSQEEGRLMVDEVNDVRILGVVTIIVLLFIMIVGGMQWEARVSINAYI